MTYLQEDSKYSPNVSEYRLNNINENLRYEIDNFRKTHEKGNLAGYVKKAKNELLEIRSQIRGFNYWAFFIVLAGAHTFRIYQTKKLLYEMGKDLPFHLAVCLGSGIASGFIVGNAFSYNLGLLRKFRKVNRKVEQISSDKSLMQ
jgi:hypothetical protein